MKTETKTDVPADAFAAVAAHLRGTAPPTDQDTAAGEAARDYAERQLDRPDLPRRAGPVPAMSRGGLALELESRARDGGGSHEWDLIHAALSREFPKEAAAPEAPPPEASAPEASAPESPAPEAQAPLPAAPAPQVPPEETPPGGRSGKRR